MVFSSELFLFIFLPLIFVLYRLIPGHRAKNALLTIGSLIFYAWGQPVYLLLLLFSVACNYSSGLALMSRGSEKGRKTVVVISVVINLGLLCVFKYLDFFIENINLLTGIGISPVGLTLPIGISFFTFQGMSYVIDTYRSPELGSRSFVKVLLYISLFPQLIAGPIVKYHDVSAQIDSRQTSADLTARGIRRFVVGLAKKLLLANTLGRVADTVFALSGAQLGMALAWLGAVCYTLQIYFDFSGYSDMAIGLGMLFGFSFKENFNYPYSSASVTEFWRRWHISLSTWLKEYLYIPLGGNRRGKFRTGLNKLTVFFFAGLWHGASWTFVLWGLFHGLMITLESLLSRKKLGVAGFSVKRVPGMVCTILLIILSFVLFRAESLERAGLMLLAMFGGIPAGPESAGLLTTYLSPIVAVTLVISIVASTDIAGALRRRLLSARESLRSAAHAASMLCTLALYLLCIMNLASTSFNPFIYFQF